MKQIRKIEFEGLEFPNYPEVKALIELFEEITGGQFNEYREGFGVKALVKYLGDIRVELENSHPLGAFLNLGYQNNIIGRKATIRVGLKPIGTGEFPGPYKHCIEIDVDHLSLKDPGDQRIFEIINKFYEKVKDLEISEEVVDSPYF